MRKIILRLAGVLLAGLFCAPLWAQTILTATVPALALGSYSAQQPNGSGLVVGKFDANGTFRTIVSGANQYLMVVYPAVGSGYSTYTVGIDTSAGGTITITSLLTNSLPAQGSSGGGGGTPLWNRAAVVLSPIPSDLSQQVQEISGLLSTSPEVLTGCTQVLKAVFTAGWYQSTAQLWSAETCDGIHFTRAPSPIPGTNGYARSFVMPNLINGNIVMFAVNTNNNHLDMFTGTTMAGLTVAHSNVLSCGANGDQTTTQGTFTAWVTSGNNWSGLQNCLTTNNNYALWSVSSTNAGVSWSQFQAGAVIGDTGVNCGGLCTDAGDRGIYYDGTSAYFWAHAGPSGVLPTPYIWEFKDPTGTGHSWTAFASPSLTAISDVEGVNLPTSGTRGPQLGDDFILPWPALGRTFIYYTAYAPACSSVPCPIPSYIEAATIPLPIATIAPLQQGDGPYTVGAPLFQVNSVPQSNPWLHNLVAGPGIILNDLGNGSVQITAASSFQDFASFAGTAGTAISSYTTTAGKTFALYGSSGTSPQSIPLLSGTGQAILAAGTTATFGDVLDSLTPSSANYTVSGTFTYLAGSGATAGLFSRASSGAATYYVLTCIASANICDMYRVVSGSATQIGGTVTLNWTAGASHTLALSITGTTNPVILATADGTTTLFSATDTGGISSAGQAGFRETGASSIQVANLTIQ